MLGQSPIQNGALPRKAAVKFATIVNDADDLRYVSQGVHEEYRSALKQHREAEADLNNWIGAGGHPTGRPTMAFSAANARQALALATEVLTRAGERRDQVSGLSQEATGLKNNIDQWLRLVISRGLRDVQRPDAKPRKGETLADAIERCRRRVRELRADARRVRSAPIPSLEAKAFADSYVASLQEAGAPALQYLMEAGIRRIDWPDRTPMIEGSTDGGRAQWEPELAPPAIRAMAWAQPDVLLQALHRDIELEADDENALTAAERFKQHATISADRFACEVEEESLIEQLRATGAAFARRLDADPRAVLGLASDLPAPADSF